MWSQPKLQYRNPPVRSTEELALVVKLLEALKNEKKREEVLFELFKIWAKKEERREKALSTVEANLKDLAPLMWSTAGTMRTLIEEIISAYEKLHSRNLTERESNRAFYALSLLQCTASHPYTKMPFIEGRILLHLYYFLNNIFKGTHHEYLRLASLDVIGALVMDGDRKAIHYLLKNEILPWCLFCMEIGAELSKTAATFIVQQILSNKDGLEKCCEKAEDLFVIGRVLGKMVDKLAEDETYAEDTSKLLLKRIIYCYYKFSENPTACGELKYCIPEKLKDSAFIDGVFRDDQLVIRCLADLFERMANQQLSKARPSLSSNWPAVGQTGSGNLRPYAQVLSPGAKCQTYMQSEYRFWK